MEMKKCSNCGELKPATSEFFYKQARNTDGFRYDCKNCKKEIDSKWRFGNSDYIKEHQKSPEFVFSQIKYQAKKRKIPFELTLDYYLKNLAHKSCYYCGSANTKYWVDRYDNSHDVGYTKENSVPSCELCNKMKLCLESDVFIEHCKKIVKFS